MSNHEALIKNKFATITDFCSRIKAVDLKTLDTSLKFKTLQKLKNLFDDYLKCFTTNIDLVPEFKRVLYKRQCELIKIKCEGCVEFLGFSYQTDFIFALELDESFDTCTESEDTLVTNTKIELNLETSFILDEDKLTEELEEFLDHELIMSAFDLKLANSLIPDFDGHHKNVEDFLDKCDFYNETLDAVTAKPLFLNFLLKVKISKRVKNKFSSENIRTFADFKKIIIDRFSDKTTKETRIDQIENLKQIDTVANFATRLETLAAELVNLKMRNRNDNDRDVIQSEVEDLAIRVFAKGLKRIEVKQALIYKEPKTLNEAVKFALEADAKFCSNNMENSINKLRTNHNHNSNNNQRNFNSNNNFRANSNSNFRNNNNHYNSRNNNQNNNNNFNNHGSSRYYTNSNRNNNNNQNPRFHNGNNNNFNHNNNNRNNNNFNNRNNQNNRNNTDNNHYNRNHNNNNNYNSRNSSYQNSNYNNRSYNNYNSNSNYSNRSNFNSSNNYPINQLSNQSNSNYTTTQGNSRSPQQGDTRVARLGEI